LSNKRGVNPFYLKDGAGFRVVMMVIISKIEYRIKKNEGKTTPKKIF